MKPLYELAQEYGLTIKPVYFTTLYIIEKHITSKTVNIAELLTVVYIFTSSNRGGSFKKIFNCIEEYFQINKVEIKVI